jgi:hypothetical protein
VLPQPVVHEISAYKSSTARYQKLLHSVLICPAGLPRPRQQREDTGLAPRSHL